MSNQPWEIVLPVSGSFARVRRATARDYFSAMGKPQWMEELIARITTIDDAPITVDQLYEMDLEDVLPIINHIGGMCSGMKGGVA